MSNLFELVKDPYERKARVVPGLLVSLPLLVPLLCVYGAEHPAITGVVGLLVGCGAIYALANVARGRGKKIEETLVKDWGGMPTTIALRHRDNFIDSISKRRYHDLIATELGISMPTADEEEADPVKADDTYIGATRRLREITRGNKQLLLTENIAYGFHRNMLAMKPFGISACVLGVVYALVIAEVLQVLPFDFLPVNLADPGLATGLTLLISLLLLVAWVFYFDREAVRRMGFVYAERLFECLSSLPPTSARKSGIT